MAREFQSFRRADGIHSEWLMVGRETGNGGYARAKKSFLLIHEGNLDHFSFYPLRCLYSVLLCWWFALKTYNSNFTLRVICSAHDRQKKIYRRKKMSVYSFSLFVALNCYSFEQKGSFHHRTQCTETHNTSNVPFHSLIPLLRIFSPHISLYS